MARHIFLTGEKRVGKSTLLKKVLARYTGKPGGFLTVRTNEYLKDSYSVHIFSYGEENLPAADNMLFVCGKPDEDVKARFEKMGCSILSKCKDAPLIVMDELGPHEADAVLFRKAVLELLDGNIPVLGILQSPADSFWPDIYNHNDVNVITVTEDNRNDETIIDNILSLLNSNH